MRHPTEVTGAAPLPARARLADVATLAVAGALTTAVVHVAITEFRFRLLDTFTWTNREFAWLSPIGYLVWFAATAVPVAVASAILPRWVTRPVVASAFAALGLLSLGLLATRIHPLATLVLAVGVGLRLGWLAARHWERAMGGLRWGAAGAALLLMIGGVAAGGGRLSETWNLAKIVPASPEAPNVILLILDTVRAANLSTYGHSRPTSPTLDRLAADGVLFEHAFSTAPWTAPSHASMMTGLWAGQTRADYRSPMDPEAPTLAQALGAHGYVTAGFMANTGFAGYQVGLSKGFTHYHDYRLSFQQALWSTSLAQTNSGRKFVEGLLERSRWKTLAAVRDFDLRIVDIFQGQRQSSAEIVDHFLAWRNRVNRAPYFAMLNFMDAHAPYEPPDGFRSRFGDGTLELDRYDGAIAYEDSVIGSLIARLRELGDLERTVFLVTADHGEQWGEHGIEGHGNSLFRPVLHVPLIVSGTPAIPRGRRLTRVVSLRDLAATILQIAGVRDHALPGSSLAALWTEPGGGVTSPVVAEASPMINPSPRNLTARGRITALIDSTWHFIRYGDGAEELFEWRVDPEGRANQRASDAGAQRAARMRSLLDAELSGRPGH